jgi:hypothetical protein
VQSAERLATRRLREIDSETGRLREGVAACVARHGPVDGKCIGGREALRDEHPRSRSTGLSELGVSKGCMPTRRKVAGWAAAMSRSAVAKRRHAARQPCVS